MTSSDPRDYGLTPRLCALVQDALRSGEQLRWVGKPLLLQRIDWWDYIGLWLFSCPFGGIGGMFLYLTLAGEGETSGFGFFFAIVMALIFVLVFVLALVSPFYRLWTLRNTAYVITNRRALIVGFDEDSWPLKRGMVANNYQRSDGSGNLVFAIRWDDERNRFLEYGFMNIRDVRLVEEILEKAIDERQKA